jgi:rSAM/selenodomain-associated transferase 1
MAKAPIPGAVKTRLVPFLSITEAAELARALLIDQLNHLKAISTADLYLAFTPQETEPLMRELAPPEFALLSQIHGDLGARMQNIFATLFAKGHKNIVLIGADLPPVPLAHFAQALAYLDHPEPRAALGPSTDGGYYLIGLNRQLPQVFDDMTWSHDQVFVQTLGKLRAMRVAALKLPQWFDIDMPDDLTLLRSTLDSSPKETAPNTSRILSALKSPKKTVWIC